MIWIIIILVLLTFLFVILTIKCKHDVGRAFFVTLAVMLAYITMAVKYEHQMINPIEVYRGNTELQITYEGDTPIDSTVVWKNK